jgi:hypothetical protein
MNFKGREIVTHDNYRLNDRVVRGRDWRWYDQDIHKGKQMVGRIIKIDNILKIRKWVRVEWENGNCNNYRCGVNLSYDLVFYEKIILESL